MSARGYSWVCPICQGPLRENSAGFRLGPRPYPTDFKECRRHCPACGIGLSNARERPTFARSDWKRGLWERASAARLGSACRARLHGSDFEGKLKRMQWERSEDLLTWNVFEHLERTGQLGVFVAGVTGQSGIEAPGVSYWGWNDPLPPIRPQTESVLRECLGERTGWLTEPDVMVVSGSHLIIVEAKFGSSSPTKVQSGKKYLAGAKGAFTGLAEHAGPAAYQLIRNWALGYNLSQRHGYEFWLVYLVRDAEEREVEKTFRPLVTSPERFKRMSWEELGMTAPSMLPFLKRSTLYFDDAFPGLAAPASTAGCPVS